MAASSPGPWRPPAWRRRATAGATDGVPYRACQHPAAARTARRPQSSPAAPPRYRGCNPLWRPPAASRQWAIGSSRRRHCAPRVIGASPGGGGAELPAGWRSKKTADGRTYYYAKGSSQTQWEFPTEPAPGAPAGGDAGGRIEQRGARRRRHRCPRGGARDAPRRAHLLLCQGDQADAMDAPDGARTDGRVSGCWPSISEWEKSREGRGGGRRGREAVGRGRGRLGGALRPRSARTRKGRVGVREWEVTYHRFLVARMIRLVCGMANVHEGGWRPCGSVAKEWLESGRQRVHFGVRVACGWVWVCLFLGGRAWNGTVLTCVLENSIQFTRRTKLRGRRTAHSHAANAYRLMAVILISRRGKIEALPPTSTLPWVLGEGKNGEDSTRRTRSAAEGASLGKLFTITVRSGRRRGGAFDPP